MLSIGIDMDSTINTMDETILHWLQQKDPHRQHLRYNLEEEGRHREEIAAFFRQEGLFLRQQVKPMAKEVLWKLHRMHRLVVISMTYSEQERAEKRVWMARHFPFLREVILLEGDKGVTTKNEACQAQGIHVLIDDAPPMLAAFPGVKIAFSHPYNQDVPVDFRFSHWRELFALLPHVIKEIVR